MLICGGAYIKLKGGNVEIGGPGKLLIKNGGIQKRGAASMQSVMKSFEPESFDEKFKLTHALTQEPLANQRYRITFANGRVLEGMTSATGETELTQSEATDDMQIMWLKKDYKPEDFKNGDSDVRFHCDNNILPSKVKFVKPPKMEQK